MPAGIVPRQGCFIRVRNATVGSVQVDFISVLIKRAGVICTSIRYLRARNEIRMVPAMCCSALVLQAFFMESKMLPTQQKFLCVFRSQRSAAPASSEAIQ